MKYDGYLIAAWGAPKGTLAVKRMMIARMKHVLEMNHRLHYIRMSKTGYPEHPLYLPGVLTPTLWDTSAEGILSLRTNAPDESQDRK